MDSFSCEYLRQDSQSQTDVVSNPLSWNSHYSLTDCSSNRGSLEEGNSTMRGSGQPPLCRELQFHELPEDIRCMYEMAKCGLPVTDCFYDEHDSMQSSLDMTQFVRKNDVVQLDSSPTPTWEDFQSSVDEASSGRWEDDGEERYKELMQESFHKVSLKIAEEKIAEVIPSKEINATEKTPKPGPPPDGKHWLTEWVLKILLILAGLCFHGMLFLLLILQIMRHGHEYVPDI